MGDEPWSKARMRQTTSEARGEAKEAVLSLRRFSSTEMKTISEDQINEDLVKILTKLKAVKFGDPKLLARLKMRLSRADEDPGNFFKVDGSLQGLVGVLTTTVTTNGASARFVVVAAHCVANLAPLNEKFGLQLVRSVGPYLVTLLNGGSASMREASAVALGNLAASGPKTVKVLVNQEAVQTLIDRLNVECNETVQAAIFYALYHILYNSQDHEVSKICQQETLARKCVAKLSPKSPLELPWVLFVLSCNDSLHGILNEVIPKIFEIFTYEIFQKSDLRPLVKIVTPLIRVLANLCAGKEISVSEQACISILRQPDLPAILITLLGTNYTHVVKETLWWFGNIVNNESVLVQEEFVELDLMDKLEYHTVQALRKLDPFL